ncbi:MAG: B3/B4 domain-containing protein [Solirubrobacterales bacterium]
MTESAQLPPQHEAVPEPGWIEPGLEGEFPGLGIFTTTVEAAGGRSPEPVRERLRDLSDRISGQEAILQRQRPIPWAYRVFFRQIGLDPDTTRTPPEDLMLARIQGGRLRSAGRVLDALAIAVAESGVAVLAFDADRIEGRLGLRPSREGERFAGRTTPLPSGTLVIADEKRPVAVLFGAFAEDAEAGKGTKRTTLAAIRVKGVPDVAIEEALWLASSAMLA